MRMHALVTSLYRSFKLIRAPVSQDNSPIAAINSQPSLLIAYFELCGELLPVIIDTGATISIIPEFGRVMTKYQPRVQPANVNVTLGDDSTCHLDKKVRLPMKPKGDREAVQTVLYVHNRAKLILGYEALIGLKSLRQFPLEIKFLHHKAQVFCHGYLISQEVPTRGEVRSSIIVDDAHLSVTSDTNLTRLLGRFKSVFADIGREPLYGKPMRILTTHNRPIFAKQAHYTHEETIQMKKHLQGLLEKGIIENTYSGYAAKSRIIPKRNGAGRLVINYMPLNAVTLRDSYCLPHVSDLLGAIQGKEFFSTLDCSQGFYQIAVDPRDRHKTAFSTPIGNFQFIRCPFGARNSCAMFQSEMNRIFREGLYTRCVVYVDDILVLGETRKDHDNNLEWVLNQCKLNNVKLKLEKCIFAQQEVDYLGFRITGRSISPLKERVETLRADKPPRSKFELRSIIGRLNFYSRFIPNYSKLLEPLRELYKKNRDFQWLQNHQKVYEMIVNSLNEAEPQNLEPRSTFKVIELHLMKDSLETLCLSKDEKLICRASRFMTPTEASYSTVEKQLLALTLAISKFRLWLHPDNFVVRAPSKGIARAMELVERPERVENLLMRIPDGFDTFKIEVKEDLTNEIVKKYKLHIPQEIYYVDGACKANGKPECRATWAVVAEFDKNLSECGFVDQTPSNQSAELIAAIKACNIAKELGQNEITIVTDSKYLHSAATDWSDKWKVNDWKDHRNKPVIHTNLFKELIDAKAGLQIEWVHVKGHSGVPGNVRADSLARSLLDEQEEAFNAIATNTHRIQSEDPEIDFIKMQIQNNERNDLMIDDDIVYYIDPKIEIGDPKRMYVPTLSRPWLLKLAHDNHLYGGHLGIKKTFSKLTRFWWPKMLHDVEEYVKSCEVCQSFKNKSGLPPGYLHSIPVSRIFEHVHLDIIGPTISSTTRGHRYMITATDAFSKWAFARPSQSVKTGDLIKFLQENIVLVHGKPDVIITDRGCQFTSAEWAKHMQNLGIKHQLTSAYHPQSNGIDERLNGTLVRILKAYVDEFQEQWDERLKHALYVYNTTVHSSTGFSPYHMMHGFDPRSPFNEHVARNHDGQELELVRKFIHQMANEQNKLAQETQKRNYDRRHSEFNLKVGQFVWVRQHTCPTDLSRKFYPKWYGPCVIVSLIGKEDNPRAVSILDFVAGGRKVVAIQDIKPHHERPKHLIDNFHKSKTNKVDTPPNGSIEVDHDNLIDFDDRLDTDKHCSDHNNFEPHATNSELDQASIQSNANEDFEHITNTSPPSRMRLHDNTRLSTTQNSNPMTSSPKRRVTFSSEVTQILPPDESSICLENFNDQNRNLDNSTSQSIPIEHNPYIMDFIIDDPAKDPDFDFSAQEYAYSTDAVDNDSTLIQDKVSDGENQQQATVPQRLAKRYNLRPLPSRISANKCFETTIVNQVEESETQTFTDLEELSAKKETDGQDCDLIPPEVTDLDEETLIDITEAASNLLEAADAT